MLILNDFKVGLSFRRIAVLIPLLWLPLVLFFASCASERGKFEKSLNDYNDLLRWHKLEEASVFAGDALSGEFMARVKSAKNMKIFDYRILRTKYDEAKHEAEVQVLIEYYMLSTNTLKSLMDIQKWVYVTENGEQQWKLMSLLPEFK